MAKFWFVSAPLHGHLDWGGFLKTAQALQARGHQTIWISEKPIAGAVAVAGVPFEAVQRTGWLWPPPPPPDLSTLAPQQAVMLRYRRALDTWLSEDLVGAAVGNLIEMAGQIGKPDLIVTDPFLSAAALAAEALDVRLAVCGWPAQKELDEDFLFPVQKVLGNESRDRLQRLCKQFGLAGRYFAQGPTPSILSSQLHITYFTRRWYAAEDDTLLPQNRFVGGAPAPPQDEAPQWLKDIPEELPLALITLGSVFTGDLGFFAWAAQAAARIRHVPLVVVGKNPIAPEAKQELVTALPPVTRLLNWVDFDHVLPRTRLIIHHGGMGTTHAALIHGIPQMVVPHAADQRGQARRVAQAKVGLHLSAHDVRHGALYEGAKALSTDASVISNARQFAAEMAALGGPQKAAEALIAQLTAPL